MSDAVEGAECPHPTIEHICNPHQIFVRVVSNFCLPFLVMSHPRKGKRWPRMVAYEKCTCTTIFKSLFTIFGHVSHAKNTQVHTITLVMHPYEFTLNFNAYQPAYGHSYMHLPALLI